MAPFGLDIGLGFDTIVGWPAAGGGSPPPSYSLVNTYTPVTGKSVGTTLTVPNVLLAALDSIVAFCAFGNGPSLLDVVWGGLALGSGFDQPVDIFASSSELAFFTAHAAPAGTHDLVLSFDANVVGALIVQVHRGLTGNDVMSPPADSGSSTTPSAGPSDPLAQANSVQVAGVLTVGPVEDGAGTWGNSLTADARGGTTGGVAASNRTLSVAHRELAATTAVTASKSGIVSRAWAAAELVLLKAA